MGGPNDRYEEKAERTAMNRKLEINKLAGSLRAAESRLKELRPLVFPVGQHVLVDDLFVEGQRARARVTSHPMDKVASLEICVRDNGGDTQYLVNIERCHAY
jgi:hypothetical protein